MTRHVLNGHFALFYGSTATDPDGDVSQWQPVTSGPDAIWTVLVLDFKDNEVGINGVKDTNHFKSSNINQQRLALIGKWNVDTSGNLTLADGHMYCQPTMITAVQDRLREIFSGAGIANNECVLKLFSDIAPTAMNTANITLSGGAGNSCELKAGDLITIQGVGTLEIPNPVT
jgi:hypothetical protein